MKPLSRLLLVLLLPASVLMGCVAQVPYSHVSQTEFYTSRPVQAYRMDGITLDREIPNSVVVAAIGFHNNMAIVRYAGGKYMVESDALSLIDYPVSPGPDYTQPSTGSAGDKDLYVGPRGGVYYINGNGNKTYVTPESTIQQQPIQTGPRGGQYYINGNGRKTYIKQ